MQESGGNATIVNKWDSNWLAGTPSVGGMQVIGPTFAAYAGPFRNVGPFEYGVSVNKLANMYAGLNYALHTYGSLGALNRAGGYDHGGYLPTGWSMAYNGTGKPEPVGHHMGGTVNYNITVNAGPATNGRDVGRQIVEYVRQFEQGSGKGWRS
jgi:SLT domain-containing protein